MLKLIKTRMTIFSTLVVFVLFITFGAFLYFGLDRLLHEQFDRQLYLLADAIEDSYGTDQGYFTFLETGTNNYEQARNNWVRIVDPSGGIYFQSDRYRDDPVAFPLEAARAHVGRKPKYFYRDFQIDREKDYRSIILAVIRDPEAGALYWVEVGEPLKHINNSLAFFRKLLLASLPLVLITVAAASFYVVNRLIRPVSLMANRAERISFENLNQRLPVINYKDEVGRLAITFNNLLQRLEVSFRQQRQLLSNISHELKTPLTVLRTHWEPELSNGNLPQKLREKLAGDVEELARLSKMVDDLSLLSRSLEDLSNLERQETDLTQLLGQLIGDLRVIAELKQQEIAWESGPAVRVGGDPRYLKRLFMNLLDNAIKYTPEGGRISVTCSESAGRVRVTVADNGIGIPAKDLPRLFERFYRAENSHQTGKGSGLGLSIAKWIAEAHLGQIKLESAPGLGCTVTVELPAWHSPLTSP